MLIAPQNQSSAHSPMQESELLKQFTLGDISAFEALFRRHQSDVFGWIVRIVRDPGIAEDLTIETFWRIHRAHARFDWNRSFEAWARKIATNVAIDRLKAIPPETPLDLEAAPSRVDTNAQQLVRSQTALAFQRLPAKLRIVVTLALVEECSYEEIADSLGLSIGAVKTRVFRGVRKLRQELKRLGVEP